MNTLAKGTEVIFRVCDSISLWSGKAVAWLIIPMTLALTYEVVVRYFFNAPTAWAYDVTFMLYGAHFMLGAAYTLYAKGHIRTDFLYRFLSPRWQGLFDAFFYLLFYFPGLILFFIVGWEYAQSSWVLQERIVTSPWLPPIYPFKTVIPVSIVLLLIQGISEFRKCLYAIVQNEVFPEENVECLGGYDI